MSGRSVLNVSAPSKGAYTFINFMKMMTVFRAPTGFAFPPILDVNGYPQESPINQLTGSFNTPATYTGNWVIRWIGQFSTVGVAGVSIGAVGTGTNPFTIISGSSFVVSSSNGMTLTGTDGYVEFKPTIAQTGFNLGFTPIGGSVVQGTIANISSIEFYRKDQESLRDAGEIFNPDYVELIAYLNPRVIRFLDWTEQNGSNRSRQGYDTTVGAMTYSSDFYVAGVWGGTCSFDGGTDTYSCSTPSGWGGYVDGATVQVFVANQNTTTAPKLTLDGTTKKINFNVK